MKVYEHISRTIRMKTILWFSGLLLFSFTSPEKAATAITLYGIVVNENTGLPLSNVYVYAVKGEEEVLTNKKGEFKFISWQPLPVSLTVLHKEYEETKVRITDASRTVVVKLKKR